MNQELRQVQLYNYIKDQCEASVSSLASYFSVSQVTIRRTIKRLEDAGLVKHIYGKVYVVDTTRAETSFNERIKINQPGKQRMAIIANKLIASNNIKSLYLDGSSSALEVAKAMPLDSRVTIFTNSFSILEIMKEKPQVRLFFLGGFMDWDDRSTFDMTTEDQCKQIYLDATFTSCRGFSENGTFNNGYAGAQIRRIMMKNSLQNYLLADHTKYNAQGVFMLTAWDSIDALITDEDLPESFLQHMEAQNVRVLSK